MTRNERPRLQRERLEHDIRRVLGTDEGRRVLWWVVDELAGLGRQMPNTEYALREAGRQDVGRDLERELLALSPDGWAKMRTEAVEATVREVLLQQMDGTGEAETE
ncbi:MAG: hypothetical protein ACRD4T_00210 [Candidatus Acidiferrales bacterium]